MAALVRSGASVYTIARLTGLSQTKLELMLRRHAGRVRLRHRGVTSFSDASVRAARHMRILGASWERVAAFLGCSHPTARKVVNRG